MYRVRNTALIALALLLAVSLVGCKPTLKKGSPAAAVQSLLELRSALTTDAARYASFVATPMASALASDSAARPSTDTPIPQWKTPEVTEQATSTAKVKVRWNADGVFSTWAKATVFSLEKIAGRWIVVDANQETGSKSTTPTP